jgi:hypothetical protein
MFLIITVGAFHGNLPQVTQTGIEATCYYRITVVTNNCNDTGIVMSGVYIWSASRHQQSYTPDSLLTLNERNIPFVNSVKYLGVIFDKRMTWRLHIEKIEAKVFRTFIRLYSLFKSERLIW